MGLKVFYILAPRAAEWVYVFNNLTVRESL